MSDIDTYKCPNCGANIEFDPHLQKLKCPYCDSEIDTNSLKQYSDDLNNEKADEFGWEEVNLDDIITKDEVDLVSYVCDSCGGEIVGDKSMSASVCPYCGNNVIIEKQFSGLLRPNYVLPFKMSKEEAKKAMLKHFKGKFLLPRDFNSVNKLEKIQGIYVPYWLFDCDADAKVRYRAQKVRTYRRGDYQYTETSHYRLYREGTMSFRMIPVDASVKLDDKLLEALEPYDFKDVVDFNTAYLRGYLSDRYELKPDDVKKRANERVKNSMIDELTKTTIGYNGILVENSYMSFNDGKINYALIPIYLLHTKYKDEKYLFAMNGQNGKFVGDLPMDKTRLIIILLITFVFSFSIFTSLIYFFKGF